MKFYQQASLKASQTIEDAAASPYARTKINNVRASALLTLCAHEVAPCIDAEEDEEQEGEAPQVGASVGEEG